MDLVDEPVATWRYVFAIILGIVWLGCFIFAILVVLGALQAAGKKVKETLPKAREKFDEFTGDHQEKKEVERLRRQVEIKRLQQELERQD
jgi:hypothetical protein